MCNSWLLILPSSAPHIFRGRLSTFLRQALNLAFAHISDLREAFNTVGYEESSKRDSNWEKKKKKKSRRHVCCYVELTCFIEGVENSVRNLVFLCWYVDGFSVSFCRLSPRPLNLFLCLKRLFWLMRGKTKIFRRQALVSLTFFATSCEMIVYDSLPLPIRRISWNT